MSAKVIAFSGGVGGAKLGRGLAAVLAADSLLIAVNVADDFEHLGLRICPDIDSNLYALAGLNDDARGWGRRDESWNMMEALRGLAGPEWFLLGDRDLAVHLLRTQWLREGESLSEVTKRLAERFGIAHSVVPVTSDPVATQIFSDEGELSFQDYFVRRRCAPRVRGFHYRGADAAEPDSELSHALADPDLRAVIICPSNPYLSVDPMLAVSGVRDALRLSSAPVVAVTPLIEGAAVKGPLTKLMEELGVPRRPAAIARHYEGLIDGFVVDARDAAAAPDVRATGVRTCLADTMMVDRKACASLARAVLDFASEIAEDAGSPMRAAAQ